MQFKSDDTSLLNSSAIYIILQEEVSTLSHILSTSNPQTPELYLVIIHCCHFAVGNGTYSFRQIKVDSPKLLPSSADLVSALYGQSIMKALD